MTDWDAGKPSPVTVILAPTEPSLRDRAAVGVTMKLVLDVPLVAVAETATLPPGVEGTMMLSVQVVPDTVMFLLMLLPNVNVTISASTNPDPLTVTVCPGGPLVGETVMGPAALTVFGCCTESPTSNVNRAKATNINRGNPDHCHLP